MTTPIAPILPLAPIPPLAPIRRRAIACLIDLAIVWVIVIVGYSITGALVLTATTPQALLSASALGMSLTGAVALVWFLVFTALQGAGASLGMRALGLRLVRDGSGTPLGFGRALLRNIVFGLSASIVVGYFTPLFDGSGRYQGWHDRAAGALVVDLRAAGEATPTAAANPALSATPAGAPERSIEAVASGWATAPGASAATGEALSLDELFAPDESSHPAVELAPAESFAPPAHPESAAALHTVPGLDGLMGHTLPGAPSAAGAAAPLDAEDPLDVTVLSAPTAAPAAVSPPAPLVAPGVAPLPAVAPTDPSPAVADADAAMITVVPGISPSVPTPAPMLVSGPEATLVADIVAPADPAISAAPATRAAPAASAARAIPAAPPVPAPPVIPVVPAAVVQPADEEGDLEDTRISIPGHRLLFVWDDGARATVSGRTLFGRNPAAEPGAAVVVVRDETLSLSKTHFEAAAEPSGGWVQDRHSTNGMTIVRDGARIACPPGERVRIRLGDAIEIGDRIVTVGGYA